MIEERYCSHEVSKLLREKGFDEPCRSYYIDNDNYRNCGVEINRRNLICEEVLRPTHQMAIDWLREVHKIHIEITIEGINSFICYKVYIRPFKKIYPTRNYDSIDIIEIPVEYNSFGEAIESAIKYCLTELI